MRKYMAVAVLATIITCYSFSQTHAIDSLKRRLPSTRDTALVNLYLKICVQFWFTNKVDSFERYVALADSLSRKIHWKLGEGKVIQKASYIDLHNANFSRCIEKMLMALEIFEHEGDLLESIKCQNELAITYKIAEDFSMSAKYCRRVMDLAKNTPYVYELWQATFNLADAYFYLDKPDSVEIYFEEANQMLNHYPELKLDPETQSWVYIGLARSHLMRNNLDIARSYLDKSEQYADSVVLPLRNYLLADIHETYSSVEVKAGNLQKAVAHSKESLSAATNGNEGIGILITYEQLSHIYEKLDKDSAIKYFKLAYDFRDSIFNVRSKAELAGITVAEAERQQKVRQEEQHRFITRKHNIQYTAMAIALVTMIILFLLYSRSVIGKEKLIKFLGVMVLLIVFEFINLYLHPYLSNLTDESPFWMLMIMVAIAAFLVPAHHRIEKWVSIQLVEKNKRIRLEAAKKTIATLGGS